MVRPSVRVTVRSSQVTRPRAVFLVIVPYPLNAWLRALLRNFRTSRMTQKRPCIRLDVVPPGGEWGKGKLQPAGFCESGNAIEAWRVGVVPRQNGPHQPTVG